MSTPADEEPPPGPADREWFDALVGRPAVDPDAVAAREGGALRMALEQRRRQVDDGEALRTATSETSMAEQLGRLLQRASDQGLIGAAPPAAVQAAAAPTPDATVIVFPWWRRRRGGWMALAASVLVGAIGIAVWSERADYPPPPVMSGVAAPQYLRDDEPKAMAERLADGLRRAGLRPGVFQRGRSYIVDITLLGSELAGARPAFEAVGAAAPVAGFNRVEISRPSAR